MALKKVEHAAAKKQVMNLDELEAFARDARQVGATGKEEIQVGVSWSGKLQKLAIDVELAPADRPTLDKKLDGAS
ncbi:hypothetical protein ACWEO4_35430 [Streptomyces sp. NPDC004393]|uniref:hypothetical protein n=1 Tax=Streptomyces sp. NPDC004533 TaxID=3154278 RepID=UPI0033B7A208